MPAPSQRPEADFAALRSALADAVARTCPPHLRDDQDDIVQAGMMRVMRAVERGAEAFNKTYLKRVAYSAMVDHLRQLETRRHLNVQAPADAPEPADPSPASPLGAIRAAQLGAAIEACLHGLVETRRRAVTLYLQGHTATEIGALLDWGTKRAENFLYRGLDQLRACLTAKGFDP